MVIGVEGENMMVKRLRLSKMDDVGGSERMWMVFDVFSHGVWWCSVGDDRITSAESGGVVFAVVVWAGEVRVCGVKAYFLSLHIATSSTNPISSRFNRMNPIMVVMLNDETQWVMKKAPLNTCLPTS